MANNVTGLYFSNSKLQAVTLTSDKNNIIIQNLYEVYFNEVIDFSLDKSTKVLEQLQDAFNEIILSMPVNSSKIAFALPVEFFHIMQVPYEISLRTEDLINEFRWEFGLLFPYLDTIDLAIQFIEIQKCNYLSHNSAIVIAILKKKLQLLNRFCENNNLILRHIDAPHIAAERTLSIAKNNFNQNIILSIYISNKEISIIISIDFKPVYFKLINNIDFIDIPEVINNEIHSNDVVSIKVENIDNCYIFGDSLNISFLERINKITGVNFTLNNLLGCIDFPSFNESNNFYKKINTFSAPAGAALSLFKDSI